MPAADAWQSHGRTWRGPELSSTDAPQDAARTCACAKYRRRSCTVSHMGLWPAARLLSHCATFERTPLLHYDHTLSHLPRLHALIHVTVRDSLRCTAAESIGESLYMVPCSDNKKACDTSLERASRAKARKTGTDQGAHRYGRPGQVSAPRGKCKGLTDHPTQEMFCQTFRNALISRLQQARARTTTVPVR